MRNDDGTYSQPDSSSDYWVYEAEPHTVYLYQHLKYTRKGRWLPVAMPMFPPKPLVIAVGREYKTVFGDKTLCAAANPVNKDYPWVFISKDGIAEMYAANGKYYADSSLNHGRDIVSEWTE